MNLTESKNINSKSKISLSAFEKADANNKKIPAFSETLKKHEAFPLTADKPEILQVNLGYMCNQTCKHCHVEAGPTRKEIMQIEAMQACLNVLKNYSFNCLDITGGAPEMNPHFRWFVEEAKKTKVKEIIVRCNLTIILANSKYNDLPIFFKKNNLRVVSSLPFYNPERTDKQRGNGVFDKSIEALQMLNNVGYGKEDNNLILDLVYNPNGAFLKKI
jgi:radical SAM/Cys-rich protein